MSQAHHVAVLQTQAIGIGGRQRQRISPRGSADRIRQLLQPSVVGIATVEKSWVSRENQFEAGGRCLGGAGRGAGAGLSVEPAGGKRRRPPSEQAIVQTGVPETRESDGAVLGRDLVLPALLDQIEIGLRERATHLCEATQENLLTLQGIVERRHHRLLQGECVAAGFEIVPTFEPMVGGQDQVARGRGFVLPQAHANPQRNLGHRGSPDAGPRIFVVRLGNVVGRVYLPEDRRRELAGGHLLDQRLEFVGRAQGRRPRRGVGDGIPQHAVQDQARGVGLSRGSRTGQNQGSVAGRAQILHQTS